METIAIIPAYNEELTISMVVYLTSKYVNKVIVVDDGSSDRTSELARVSGAEVIRIDNNKGKANAMIVGIRKAKEYHCDTIVMLDADGQHNPDEIPKVTAPILNNTADIVIGSRYLIKSGKTPMYRRFGQKTLDFATNIGNNIKVTDTQSGFRAFRCSQLSCADFKSEGYNIESDMIHYFLEKGLKLMEVPITVRYEVPQKHKKNPVQHGLDILVHIIGLISYRRPLLTFGVPGVILVGAGFVIGGYAFNRFVVYGIFHYVLFMMVAFMMVLGLLLLTTGLILNSLMKIVKMEL